MITTQRLRLRRSKPEDQQALQAILCDPSVMWHMGGGPLAAGDVAELLRRSEAEWSTRGWGGLVVEHQEDAEIVGWCGFGALDGGAQAEVFVILAEAHWGQSLGTEVLSALIGAGFSQLGFERLWGTPHDGNVAAHRVAEKSGLQQQGGGRHAGIETLDFAAERGTWRAPS